MKNIKCRNCFFYRNEWCEKIVDSPDPEEARDCNYFRDMTNADRIRSMSDEELAEIIDRETDSCAPTGDCERMSRDCKACWLEWLQQPAEENDHCVEGETEQSCGLALGICSPCRRGGQA